MLKRSHKTLGPSVLPARRGKAGEGIGHRGQIGEFGQTFLRSDRDRLRRSNARTADAAVFHTGLTLRPGERAVAIPVVAVSAVGGAIAPGARVDVIAVPLIGRAPAGRTVELLAADALVLDVRSESGAPYQPRRPDATASVDRIGSVIIAIAPSDEIRFADRIATSTFVLVFSSAR